MSRKPRDRSKSGGGGGVEDEVETLLRSAEDEVLLNLSIDSHATRGSSHSPSSFLDPDLYSRFQALKSSKPPPPRHRLPPQKAPSDADDDDLFARFAALKGTVDAPVHPNLEIGKREKDDGDDEDEVEKVMRWAIDAARLDPSPQSDVDDEDDVDCDEDDDVDSNDDSEDDRNKKGKEPHKNKKKNN